MDRTNNERAEAFVGALWEQWEGGNAPGCGEEFDGRHPAEQVGAFVRWVGGFPATGPGSLAEWYDEFVKGK